MHNKGVLSNIDRGDPLERYHWVVGFHSGKLIVVGAYNNIPGAQKFISENINGIVVHLNTCDLIEALKDIRAKLRFLKMRHTQ